jgi:hypothetical protein
MAWVYARASTAEAVQAKVLAPDQARRIAMNIARLAALLGRDNQPNVLRRRRRATRLETNCNDL